MELETISHTTMNKYIISALCFWGLAHNISGQLSRDLENKYWTYRDRYRNYFTKIGGEAGESQSAASIYQSSVQSLNYKLKNKQE